MRTLTLCLAALAIVPTFASISTGRSGSETDAEVQANPIRKVVTMLQAMQKKVEAEGKAEEELHHRFVCYCQKNGANLGGSIASGEGKGSQLDSSIKESESKKVQVQEEIASIRASRAAAESAMEQATKIRENEATAFAEAKERDTTNIAALKAAIAAVTKGMQGAFVQTGEAQLLQNFITVQPNLADYDRRQVLAFLTGSHKQGYAPQSGEINGILKQILENMEKEHAETVAQEEKSIELFHELMDAKKREVAALTDSLEEKLQRAGSLGVKVVMMKDDAAATTKALMEDKHFVEHLRKSCASHDGEWEERVKTRNEELTALAETIKILNDDDALDLFKKTLPSPSSSFVQTAAQKAIRLRALSLLRSVQEKAHRPDLDFIALAIQGKAVGFKEVLKMIDSMVANLKKEQVSDDEKKASCTRNLDDAEDKMKAQMNMASDLKKTTDEADEQLAATESEIKALEKGLKDLDESVAEAGQQRAAEHVEFTEVMASDSAAKELLNFAKNRLNKFYNPKLHKAAPKRELGRDERMMTNLGHSDLVDAAPPPGGIANTGIAALAQEAGAPPPPPETLGAYAKKSAENTGVIAMMDLLIKDLDKDMQEAQVEEENAKKDYEQMVADSKAKKAQDIKTLTEKKNAKAAVEEDLEGYGEEMRAAARDVGATGEYLQSLHAECDWLLGHFDMRKEARSSEIDALGKAKDVLNGANYEA